LFAPAFASIYTKNIKSDKHASGWGDIFMFSTIAQAVSAFVGGITVVKYGFDGLFLLQAILASIGLLVSLVVFPQTKK
jgi:predicted MFS family arabinose efflux permease